MKLIFSDPTPRWVPFASAALIVAGVWFAGVWENFEFAMTTKFSLGLAALLLIGIALQGRLFWKGQIDQLVRTGGDTYEATTSVWLGRGRRVPFSADGTSDWTTTGGSRKDSEGRPLLGSIYFTARDQRLDMSFVNPALVDLDELVAINPEYFAKVKADYPQLKSIAG